jgi:hypothetical protein
MADTTEVIARLRTLAEMLTEAETKSQAGFDQWCLEAANVLAAQAQEIATAHKMMDQDKQDYDELKERFDAQAQEIEACNELAKEYNALAERAEAAEARARELEERIA